MRKKPLLFSSLFLVLAISTGCIYICNKAVKESADGKLFSNIETIPANKVGLLLGTSKFLANGHDNPYYDYRIKAAARLIKAGKIKYLIVSGDNSRKDYNEPEEMQHDLIKEGVDSTSIYLDFAGFRTFDSMVRLKEIFGQDSVTVISQAFHNERPFTLQVKKALAPLGLMPKT